MNVWQLSCSVSILVVVSKDRNTPLNCTTADIQFAVACLYKWKHSKWSRCHELFPEPFIFMSGTTTQHFSSEESGTLVPLLRQNELMCFGWTLSWCTYMAAGHAEVKCHEHPCRSCFVSCLSLANTNLTAHNYLQHSGGGVSRTKVPPCAKWRLAASSSFARMRSQEDRSFRR